MKIRKQVVKTKNPLQTQFDEHFFYDGFPVISEADNEEVIQNFLEEFKKSTRIDVPRSMVPPALNVDLYKPKRKRAETTYGEQEPKTKEIKKEAVTTSEKQKEDPAEKEKVAQKEAVVAEKVKNKDLKRKSSGVKIDEGRSKMKHDKKSKKDESSTESDEETVAQKLKKTSEAYAKEMHKKFSKGVTKFGEVPSPDSIAQHLFEDKQVPDLTFLETHLSPNPLAEQEQQQQNETQPQPQSQLEKQPQQQPEQGQTQPEPERNPIPSINPSVLKKIKIIQKATPSEPLKPIFSHPYQFITNSEPDNELLQLQIYEDFKNLS
ncbi:hypothetical protein A2U01_0014327, partial [Trifolium medium]|nr:hypothetical protein [Trifolium medium]